MRAVAFNIKYFEKELLAKANAKVHDLTLISNGLNLKTAHFAAGKEVVIISDQDILDKFILKVLSKMGVKNIITRSVCVGHIDVSFASTLHIHVANTPLDDNSLESIAEQTIINLNNWESNRCLGDACHYSLRCMGKDELNKYNNGYKFSDKQI